MFGYAVVTHSLMTVPYTDEGGTDGTASAAICGL